MKNVKIGIAVLAVVTASFAVKAQTRDSVYVSRPSDGQLVKLTNPNSFSEDDCELETPICAEVFQDHNPDPIVIIGGVYGGPIS